MTRLDQSITPSLLCIFQDFNETNGPKIPADKMILNIAHEILHNDGHARIKIKETKATKLPEGALFDCYTYDPPGLSKTGNLGRVNEKLAI